MPVPRLGFAEVIEREDLTCAKAGGGAEGFRQQGGGYRPAVIYDAGHGVETNGENDLCSAGCQARQNRPHRGR
jgi:hypothetical protein